MKKRLAIVTSHPIQYNAPLFELLAKRDNIAIKVFYTWGESVLQDKFDPGFGKVVEWDIPLLQGYEYEFLENTATDKGSHHFKGIVNPGIIDSIKKYKPDAILVYGWSFKSHLNVLRYFKNKVPLLFRGDSTLLDHAGFIATLKRSLFLRWVYRHIDIALYVGKNNYDYYRKAGVKEKQLVFGPHVIDNDRFLCQSTSCKASAIGLRDKLHIAHDAFVFLFAGKLEPKKDPALLLKTFSDCNFSNDLHLVITGNGILEKMLKEKYQQKDNIHFLDFQNQLQMPALYEMADVFVLPSKGPGETWGLSVNEAMANGKAVIVSDKCGCAADLVENGKNGFVFKATDDADLRQKLTAMAAQKNTLGAMKQYSLNKIALYSPDKLAAVIENVVINKNTINQP